MNLETVTDQDVNEGSQDIAEFSKFSFDVPDAVAEETDSDILGLDEYLENGYDYEVPKRGDIREGVIIDANDYGLIVDIGFKREGLVPTEDLDRLDDKTREKAQVGETVAVFVLRAENRDGHPILSINQARLYEDWLEAERMMESGELYEGTVSGSNRGGLIVKFGKIRGFIPASQIVGIPRRLSQDKRQERLESKIGEEMGLKVIEVNRKRRRLIFSQRRAYRAWQESQREHVIEELEEGETRHGKVTSITDFGAFVDLGGADGLIHISELSWSRVDTPREVVEVGDEVDVYVLNVDKKRKRIGLSLKALQPDPWTLVDDHYQVEELVEGKVTRVVDFGAFIELDLGIEGLLHVSEMIGTPELKPSEIVQAGEKILVKIIRIDSNRRRIALSAKRVRRNEWERWIAAQQVADKEEEKEIAETGPDAEAIEAIETAEETADQEPVAEAAEAEEADETRPDAETIEAIETAEETADQEPVAEPEEADETGPDAETIEAAEETANQEPVAEPEEADETGPDTEAIEAIETAEEEKPDEDDGEIVEA